MGQVIEVSFRPAGNGAREALIEIVSQSSPQEYGASWQSDAADFILAMLWYHGFKVVPVDGMD